MKKILSISVLLSCAFCLKIPVYSSYVEKAYASEAAIYIKTIYKQAAIFYTYEGHVPSTLDEMKDLNLLDLDPMADINWYFDLSQLEEPTDEAGDYAGLRGIITATSTEEMDGGAGELVAFNAETGEFCGYGHAECSGNYNDKRYYAEPKARKQGRPTNQDDCNEQGGIWFTNYYYDGICISEKEYRSFRD
tara:strand:- start:133 stop:705 length:573 start_codon:yes stop_codon:yes gene_type:complete